ncbi:uncharacterized protein LOC129582075 [Paramacrobiotus metropolitanus]|uniref:uncharacterized protein LOC129582075 n=1 Tax=Paramacrobiotus metropolitanus TaxID=2943436 RepID=UPI002445ACED|nr:uncharacterized protein LOC129582075 [Paramacrobiotus metropolitanus]
MDCNQMEQALEEKRKAIKQLEDWQKQWATVDRNHKMVLKDIMARLDQPPSQYRRPFYDERCTAVRVLIGQFAEQRQEIESQLIVAEAKFVAYQRKLDTSLAVVNKLLSKFSEEAAKNRERHEGA